MLKILFLPKLYRVSGCLVLMSLLLLSQSLADKPLSDSSRDSVTLSEKADLRGFFKEWGLARRVQGSRGTCSVFAVTGALEYAAASKQKRGTPLSVEYLNWASNQVTGQMRDGGFFSDLWRGFEAYGICTEQEMPYRNKFDPALAPSKEIQDRACQFREIGCHLHWIKKWNPRTGLTEKQLVQIKKVLSEGWPVCGGLRWPKRPRWIKNVLETPPPEGVIDGHSILLVGYQEDAEQAGGGLFIFRNSNNGGKDEYMTYEYASAYMNDAVWIDFQTNKNKQRSLPGQ